MIADEDRISVRYPNGQRATVGKFLWVKRYPPVRPGSTIHVPTLPEGEREGTDWGAVITQTTGILSSVATVIVLIARL